MLNLNNNFSCLKREILVRIARLQFAGKLPEGIHAIAEELAPKGLKPIRCCVYHDREILRQRVIARLGCGLEDYDDEKSLSGYAQEALARENPLKNWTRFSRLKDPSILKGTVIDGLDKGA